MHPDRLAARHHVLLPEVELHLIARGRLDILPRLKAGEDVNCWADSTPFGFWVIARAQGKAYIVPPNAPQSKAQRKNSVPGPVRDGFSPAFSSEGRLAEIVNKALENRALVLDRLFDFQQLFITGCVLLSVIVAGHVTTLEGNKGAHHTWKRPVRICRQARVASAPPDWRHYLVTSYAAFEACPDHLPSDNAKRTLARYGAD